MFVQSDLTYYEETNEFSFFGKINDSINDDIMDFDIRFTSAQIKVEVFNSCKCLTYYENPWDYLRTISFGIEEKYHLKGDYLNEQEKELLPIIREIIALEYIDELKSPESIDFNLLITLSQKHGQNRLSELLKRLGELPTYSRKRASLVLKITAILDASVCEPMWREVFNRIQKSQETYPEKILFDCPNVLLLETRQKITKKLHAEGYGGTYPLFCKVAPMKGIHIEDSYNMTYFVGMKKQVTYHIRCNEFCDGEALNIQFLCATDLSKNQSENDCYSCMFDSKGHKLYKNMNYRILLNETEDDKSDDFDLVMGIVIKKAECLKLNKAEKKEYYGNHIPSCTHYFGVFIIAGALFAIALIFALMLVSIAVTAIVLSYKDIPDMLAVMPWGWLFLFSWVGCGGLMGLVQFIADRK